MGMSDPLHQIGEGSAGRPIVAFDFDGTITVRDSFRAFLRWRAGPLGYAAGLVRLAPAALAYLARPDRGALKAAMVGVFLKGVARGTLEAEAEAFAEHAAPRLFRPDALAAWERHRAEGALLVIVTASPDLLVAPFAARLGADRLLGTRLVFDAEGRVEGALHGLNCRGAEKVVRLEAAFGPGLRLAAAYGDSAGDREMVAIAGAGGVGVFKGRPAAG
jgi:phosphatidylglycerophosphatase C